MNKNSIKLGWILYKIIGYASYSLKFKPNYEVPKFYSSKLGAIYNIILTVSVSFVLVKAEVDSHYDKENTTNSLIKIIKSGEAVLGVVAIVTAYLTYVFAQKSIVHVQNYISEIGQAMFLLDHRYKAKNLTKFYLKNILFQLVVCMLLILSQHLAYGLYSTYQNIMMSFLISYFVLQYTSYVTRLSEKLRHLNDLLQALKTNCETKLGFYFNSSVNRLDRLRKLHAVIYSLTKKVADFYSFAMLTTCSYLLVSQTLSIHFVMDTLLNESDDELFVVFMLNNVCWFLAQGGPIVKLTNSIDDLVFEQRNTAEIVHDLYSKTNDKEFKVKLREFSTKLLNQHGDFTAAHLFPINSTVLHSMLTAVTQYIIIIVQFNTSKKDKSKDNHRG